MQHWLHHPTEPDWYVRWPSFNRELRIDRALLNQQQLLLSNLLLLIHLLPKPDLMEHIFLLTEKFRFKSGFSILSYDIFISFIFAEIPLIMYRHELFLNLKGLPQSSENQGQSANQGQKKWDLRAQNSLCGGPRPLPLSFLSAKGTGKGLRPQLPPEREKHNKITNLCLLSLSISLGQWKAEPAKNNFFFSF